MSSLIAQMVFRKRAIKAQTAADILSRDLIIAQARGDTGPMGPVGPAGRGISSVKVDKGDLIITYTDKKTQNVGKVVSERVVVVTSAPGGSTPSEDEVMLAKRVDFFTDDLFYKGESAPGTPENNQGWRIVRTTISPDGDVKDEWAEGTADFTHVWSDRLNYTYS